MIEPSMTEPVITPLETYLILQLDSIAKVSGISSIVLGIALAVVLFLRTVGDTDFKPATLFSFQKFLRRGSFLLCFLVLLSAFLPSSKNMAATILIPHIVNNQEVQKLPQELLGLLRELIQEWMPKPEYRNL